MHRQPSQKKLKKLSQSKQSTSHSKKSPHPHPTTSKNPSTQSNPKKFHPKNEKKIQSGRKTPTGTRNKPVSSGKPLQEEQSINMKKDLKNLMSKNTNPEAAKSVKNNQMVSNVLRNIERNCKALKKLHQEEQRGTEKGRSSQQNSRDKKVSITKPHQSHELGRSRKQVNTTKNNRKSMVVGTNKAPKEKEAIQRTSVQVEKNFMELVQLYKRTYEKDEGLTSHAKTNHRTNQSRNSSAYQSHAHDSNLNKPTPRQKHLQAVRSLLQSQQTKREKGPQLESPPERPQKPLPNNQEVKRKLIEEFEGGEEQSKGLDRSGLEKCFECSRFYVQPVPPFRRAPTPESLEGCSIPLIDNNMLQIDSDISQLEL